MLFIPISEVQNPSSFEVQQQKCETQEVHTERTVESVLLVLYSFSPNCDSISGCTHAKYKQA